MKLLSLAQKYYTVRFRLKKMAGALKGTGAYKSAKPKNRDLMASNAYNEIWAILAAFYDAKVIDLDVCDTAQAELSALYFPHHEKFLEEVFDGKRGETA